MCGEASGNLSRQTKTELSYSSNNITSNILILTIIIPGLTSLVVKGRRKGYFKRRYCLKDAYTHSESYTQSTWSWLVSGEEKNINCIGIRQVRGEI